MYIYIYIKKERERERKYEREIRYQKIQTYLSINKMVSIYLER